MLKLCRKLYASGTASADNVATTIVPQKLKLVGITWCINSIAAGAVGSSTWFQLSTMSTSSWTNNDVSGIIAEFMAGSDKAVNINTNVNLFQPIPGLDFNAGEVIRLHRYALVAAGTSISIVELQFV